MLIRCPACGAQASLDVLIDDTAAAEALRQALELAPLGPRLVRYLALFRPVKTRLTWPRVNGLLSELVPAIRTEMLTRNGHVHAVPQAAWAAALDEVLAARDNGQLRLPLKSHGYLYEVAIGKAADVGRNKAVAVSGDSGASAGNASGLFRPTATAPTSATARAIDKLQARKPRHD